MIWFNKYDIRLSDPVEKEVMYMQFESLSKEKSLIHRVFTRMGGVSKRPFESLNISSSVGDDTRRVEKNLQIIKNNMGSDRLLFMDQFHGDDIISINKKDDRPLLKNYKGDALITNIPYTTLMVKQADCQGIILFDRARHVLAVVHSGWRGSTLNIIGKVVGRMMEEYKCDPYQILAAIGPSLGLCCAEFVSYREIFPASFQTHMVKDNYFNLWDLSITQLLISGLRRENIETSGICTKCNNHLFFSYRGEGTTGRFATAAMIIG
jgi:YfiH family protein